MAESIVLGVLLLVSFISNVRQLCYNNRACKLIKIKGERSFRDVSTIRQLRKENAYLRELAKINSNVIREMAKKQNQN